MNAPITIHVDNLSKKMSLTTTLSPLPGENYIYKGSFKYLPGSKRSLPLGKSFEITAHASQTAFPDPLQYLGCLSNAMVPPCPHREDEVEPLAKVLEQKARLANALLPQGKLNQTAKEQLEAKKVLFKQHQEELLPLHQTLLHHLLGDTHADFFEPLYLLENPLEHLAGIYREFALLFIEKPFHRLQHEWLKGQNPSPACLAKETAKTLLRLKERGKERLLISLGEALSAPCHSILLQHLSENLGFCPPALSDFERKLQTLLYRQLLTFFHELEEKKTLTLDWIKHQMQAETALFTKPSPDAHTSEAARICDAMEKYYVNRHNLNEIII